MHSSSSSFGASGWINNGKRRRVQNLCCACIVRNPEVSIESPLAEATETEDAKSQNPAPKSELCRKTPGEKASSSNPQGKRLYRWIYVTNMSVKQGQIAPKTTDMRAFFPAPAPRLREITGVAAGPFCLVHWLSAICGLIERPIFSISRPASPRILHTVSICFRACS